MEVPDRRKSVIFPRVQFDRAAFLRWSGRLIVDTMKASS